MQVFDSFPLFVSKIAGLAAIFWWIGLRFLFESLPCFVQRHLILICVALSFLCFIIDNVFFYPRYRSPLRHLPTARTSNAMGFITESPRGETPLQWFKENPDADLLEVRFYSTRSGLMPISPVALRDVMSTNTYDFVKPWELRAFLARVIGFALITSEGAPHKHQRKALTPAFNIKHIRGLYPTIWQQTGVLLNEMKKESEEAGCVEISSWASRLALDVIGRGALSRDFKAMTSSENRIAQAFFSVLDPEPHMIMFFGLNLLFPPSLASRLPVKANRILAQESRYLRSVCEEILDEKQAAKKLRTATTTPLPTEDVKDSYFDPENIKTKETDPAPSPQSNETDILQHIIDSGEFTKQELVDQMLTFIAAGHETTAASISWGVHLLTLPEYKHYQQILRDEIRSVIPPSTSPDGKIGRSDSDKPETPLHTMLESLPYLNGVCEEVFRLFPAVPMTIREAVRDTTIAGTTVPKGTLIVIAPWAINRNPQFWGPNAEKMVPERWIDTLPDGTLRANKHGGAISNYCEVTFLHGQRSCIGRDFAKAEMRCALAGIFGRFEANRLAGDNGEVEISGAVTTKPRGGLHVRLKTIEGW